MDSKKQATVPAAVVANEIARHGVFDLTTHQIKLLLLMISRIRKGDDIDTWYELSRKDIGEALNVNIDGCGTYHSKIHNDLAKLQEKYWFRHGEGTVPVQWVEGDDSLKIRVENGRKKELEPLNLSEKPVTEKERHNYKWSGVIHYRFGSYIAPYLFALAGNFTVVELNQIYNMTSKHAIRIYMLLKSYIYRDKLEKNQPQTVTKKLDELKGIMFKHETAEKMETKTFLRLYLKPAIEEINKKTDLFHVEMTYEKDRYSKAYSSAVFTITKAGYQQKETTKETIQKRKYRT